MLSHLLPSQHPPSLWGVSIAEEANGGLNLNLQLPGWRSARTAPLWQEWAIIEPTRITIAYR